MAQRSAADEDNNPNSYNCRLFVGNIPKSMTNADLRVGAETLFKGVVGLITYTVPDDQTRNRGFCFIEFASNKLAAQAKRTLIKTKFCGCRVLADWADPQPEPNSDVMATVKVLYIKNLVMKVTDLELKVAFEQYGTVERVKRIRDYAFIHFQEREDAINAMVALNGHTFHSIAIEVVLAKPPADKKSREDILKNRERRIAHITRKKHQADMPAENHSVRMARGDSARQDSQARDKELQSVSVQTNLTDPSFTDEFLDHNKNKEAELIQMRKGNIDLEGQNVLMSQHIESMKSVIEKLEAESSMAKGTNASILEQLVQLRGVLVSSIASITISGKFAAGAPLTATRNGGGNHAEQRIRHQIMAKGRSSKKQQVVESINSRKYPGAYSQPPRK